jgi:hypothetical protein
VVLFHFIDEYGVRSDLVGLPILGLIALVEVLGQIGLPDVEAFAVEYEDLENDSGPKASSLGRSHWPVVAPSGAS